VRKMAREELTPKQEMFVREYLVDLNATQAAIRAGYSKKTAGAVGHEVLKKPEIQAAIQKAMQSRAERTQITADRVLEEWSKIAFMDIKEVVDWDENGITIRPSAEVDGSLIAEISQIATESGHNLKIKMHDKMKALDSVARHLGMFNDKLNLSGNTTINVRINGGDTGD